MADSGTTVTPITSDTALPPGPASALLVEVSQLFNSRLQIDEIIALLAKQVAERLEGVCIFFMQYGGGHGPTTSAWW